MDRKMLRDEQWERIEQLLPGKAGDRGVTAKDNRRFVEAVLWIMRTGSPWRDLPAELGHWHRTFVRFSRWREKGVWERIATALRGDADLEQLFRLCSRSLWLSMASHGQGQPLSGFQTKG